MIQIDSLFISRHDAIIQLAYYLWSDLNNFDKIEMLFDYHLLEASEECNDDDYYRKLQAVNITDELLHNIYSIEFQGVKNEYLQSLLLKHTGKDYVVVGVVELTFPCECCGFMTMKRRDSAWDICHVCRWEDTISDPEQYCFVNKSTLSDARKQFFDDSDKVNQAISMYASSTE